jgi:hypothetical protein
MKFKDLSKIRFFLLENGTRDHGERLMNRDKNLDILSMKSLLRNRGEKMPKVFTGKVIIPGDKIDEYLEMLEKAEEKRKPFVENVMRYWTSSLIISLRRRVYRKELLTTTIGLFRCSMNFLRTTLMSGIIQK